jgi:hypothetical protein
MDNSYTSGDKPRIDMTTLQRIGASDLGRMFGLPKELLVTTGRRGETSVGQQEKKNAN